jgi:hypothetical protein
MHREQITFPSGGVPAINLTGNLQTADVRRQRPASPVVGDSSPDTPITPYRPRDRTAAYRKGVRKAAGGSLILLL